MKSKIKFTEDEKEKIEQLMKEMKNSKLYKKLEVISLASKGYTNEEISKITNYSIRNISLLKKHYKEEGMEYFKEEHRKGGNHRNLSYEDEEKILNKYEESAEKGQVIRVSEIEEEYQKKCGHKIGAGTIYRVLKRHNWRKVMPRSKHPKKADDKKIEESKKN